MGKEKAPKHGKTVKGGSAVKLSATSAKEGGAFNPAIGEAGAKTKTVTEEGIEWCRT